MATLDTPTSDQQKIAQRLEICISGDTALVAAARILEAVADAIQRPKCKKPSTEKQRELARSLGVDVTADSVPVASARIREELHRRNVAAQAELQLRPGDRVALRSSAATKLPPWDEGREFIVASVNRDSLRVWFQGGQGKSAWPTQLRRVE